MALLGQSTFSVKKLIDGKTLTFNLSANCYSQIMSKDPTTFLPDFTQAGSNLVVTPYLYESGGGSTNKVVSAPRWFINTEELQGTNGTTNKTKWGATVNTTASYTLVINKNLTDNVNIIIRAEYDYTDVISGAQTTVIQEITVTRQENAGTTILAQIDCPQDTFVTTTAGVAASDLVLTARMIRGGEEDTTGVTYKWFVRSYSDSLYKQITTTAAPSGSGLPAGALFAGANTKTLTVKSGAVINVGSFKLEVTDTDTTSSTYNKTAVTYVTLFDMTDPYEVKIDQPQGDGVNTTNSVAAIFQVWQKGAQVADTWFNSKSLKFFRNTAAGAQDTTWVPSPAFTGWTVTAGVVSRAYSSGTGTVANRTITIANSHLLTDRAVTVFTVQIDG